MALVLVGPQLSALVQYYRTDVSLAARPDVQWRHPCHPWRLHLLFFFALAFVDCGGGGGILAVAERSGRYREHRVYVV